MEDASQNPARDESRSFLDIEVEKVTGLNSHPAQDALAVEEPLEIKLGHGPAHASAVKSISVTMRTQRAWRLGYRRRQIHASR